jgi:CHAT domain-containing protein
MDSTAISSTINSLPFRGFEEPNWSPFQPDESLRSNTWKYLSGSASEALEIKGILQTAKIEVQLDTGYFATEESIKLIGYQTSDSPRILHIATHGYFFPDPKSEVNNGLTSNSMSAPMFKISELPMIRSGLVLAGAQEVWTSGIAPKNREDGILTAYEISQMNLSNTELVVLSACETGLGDIEGNEGVYGLQRAFKIAGAKYLIMSLWKVSDQSTKELMTDFYHHWLNNGMTIPEAFRVAQQNMKLKYPEIPYYWAGFVLLD